MYQPEVVFSWMEGHYTMASQISPDLQDLLDALAKDYGLSVDDVLHHLMQGEADDHIARPRRPTAFPYTRYQRITPGRTQDTLRARLLRDALSLWENSAISPSSGNALPVFQRSAPR